MIYLVSGQQELFDSSEYHMLSVHESLNLLNQCEVLQYDSETSGRNPHLCSLLCVQFGNDALDIQIVVDCTTVSILLYKNILESKFIIGHNLKFDLQFLYNYGIVPRKVYDTMIVDQLLYLGYPQYPKPGSVGHSLNAVAERLLGINIDKTVRGEIIWRGLDINVILYAAGDVTYLEKIMHKQIELCRQKECLIGAKLECDFVPAIAYLEWCGIKLDIEKWQHKMDIDNTHLNEAKKALDSFLINRADHFNLYEFIEINNQGDLFSGFDLTPKANINWDSSKQVIILAKKLGFNTTVQDKQTGEDKDSVLEKTLKVQKGINDEFLDLYFTYKEYSKVCSTYGQTYLDAINPKTGRIHTTFWQLGAASGRMSCGSNQQDVDLAKAKSISPKRCTYVQLQNLPANEATREAFVSEEGNLFCSCDFSA